MKTAIAPAASSWADRMIASESNLSQVRTNVPSGISSLAAREAGELRDDSESDVTFMS
jgi:hypothetical protein